MRFGGAIVLGAGVVGLGGANGLIRTLVGRSLTSFRSMIGWNVSIVDETLSACTLSCQNECALEHQ